MSERTKYMRNVRTDPPLQLDMNAQFRKPTAVMCGCQTWSMTDRITISKFLGEEYFEEGVWASNRVRGLENENQPRTEGIT
jgi:hypothetical protein